MYGVMRRVMMRVIMRRVVTMRRSVVMRCSVVMRLSVMMMLLRRRRMMLFHRSWWRRPVRAAAPDVQVMASIPTRDIHPYERLG